MASPSTFVDVSDGNEEDFADRFLLSEKHHISEENVIMASRAHQGQNWPYHQSNTGEMVPCKSNPCKLHGGSDVYASSPEEAFATLNSNMVLGMMGESSAAPIQKKEPEGDPIKGYGSRVAEVATMVDKDEAPRDDTKLVEAYILFSDDPDAEGYALEKAAYGFTRTMEDSGKAVLVDDPDGSFRRQIAQRIHKTSLHEEHDLTNYGLTAFATEDQLRGRYAVPNKVEIEGAWNASNAEQRALLLEYGEEVGARNCHRGITDDDYRVNIAAIHAMSNGGGHYGTIDETQASNLLYKANEVSPEAGARMERALAGAGSAMSDADYDSTVRILNDPDALRTVGYSHRNLSAGSWRHVATVNPTAALDGGKDVLTESDVKGIMTANKDYASVHTYAIRTGKLNAADIMASAEHFSSDFGKENHSDNAVSLYSAAADSGKLNGDQLARLQSMGNGQAATTVYVRARNQSDLSHGEQVKLATTALAADEWETNYLMKESDRQVPRDIALGVAASSSRKAAARAVRYGRMNQQDASSLTHDSRAFMRQAAAKRLKTFDTSSFSEEERSAARARLADMRDNDPSLAVRKTAISLLGGLHRKG